MSDKVSDLLMGARFRLLLNWPLFGQIIIGLELKEVEWIETVATDGKFFYYNRKFVEQLNEDQMLFATGHEVLHCCYDHVFRRGERDAKIWNIAVDLLVNYDLIHQGIGEKINGIGTAVTLYDPKISSDLYSAEQLYDLLAVKNLPSTGTLDQHFDGGGDQEEKDGPPRYSDQEIDEIRETIKNTLVQAAAQEMQRNPGKVPAGIQRMLDRMAEPKINWRHMLDSVLRSSIRSDYTYSRISRRYWSSGFILPGRNVIYKVEAIAFLDGSGSTTKEMISDFLSECKGIMKSFRDFKLTVGTFDTQVYNVCVYTPDNADDIDDYIFKGGGGTSPSCCWKYMNDNEIMPHKLLIFTDGYVGNDWGDPDYCDTLFIIHGNTVKAPYGRTVYYQK